MKQNGTMVGLALLALPPLLMSFGCTGSNPLPPSNGSVQLHIEASPIVVRAPELAPWTWAAIVLRQVTVRPVDPTADAILGPEPLGLLGTTSSGDLTRVGGTTSFATALKAGSYSVQGVVFERVELSSVVPPVQPSAGNCAKRGSEDRYDPQNLIINFDAASSKLDIPAGTVVVPVQSGGAGVLHVTIDGAGLDALVNSKVACLPPETQGAETSPVSVTSLTVADIEPLIRFSSP